LLSALRIEPEAAAKLLQEQSGAHRGPQEEQRVHEGQVDALVVEVAGEEDVRLALASPPRRGVADLVSRATMNRERWDPVVPEVLVHEFCVLDAHAEAESAYMPH